MKTSCHRRLVKGIVCASLLATWPLALAGAESPLAALVTKVDRAVNPERALATVKAVYSTDRWFTFPKFEETCRYLSRTLRAAGLKNVETLAAPADGKTQAGFWTMPLAWDVQQATLTMRQPEVLELANYRQTPTSLGMWSGPTPPGGLDAELVDLNRTGWPAVRGKFVLTDRLSAGFKSELVANGAVGAINAYSENPALSGDRQWVNAWGDSGWGFTGTSTPLVSFSITPALAAQLRKLLQDGQRVTLHAEVSSSYYAGRYPYVTAIIPGTGTGTAAEEVLTLGHNAEQGANDNATGVAAMVEAVTTLETLIRSGQLPRPRRSIRILTMPEMYGSLHYVTTHLERMQRTVAAIAVDTPAASYELPGTEYTFYLNPHSGKSYVDPLILRIAAQCLGNRKPARPYHFKEQIPGTDSYLGEPTVGVPTVWPYSGTGVHSHHISADTPATVDVRSLRDVATMTAVYLYFLATAGEGEVPWLAEITTSHARTEMEAADTQERVTYLAERNTAALLSILRLVPAARQSQARQQLEASLIEIARLRDERRAVLPSQPITVPAEARSLVVKRKRIGTIPLDDLPQDQWEGFPSGAWSKVPTTALYWCDGRRNLAEVIRLTQLEAGRTPFDFVGYFRFLEKHGYVEFVR